MSKLKQYRQSYDMMWYYKIAKFLKRKPRTKEEAERQVLEVYPNSGMKIFWDKKEIGLYRWKGEIYNPILKRKITDGDCEGYDLAHGLMCWIFNKVKGGCGGIAGNIYGCIDGKVISYRQSVRMANW